MTEKTALGKAAGTNGAHRFIVIGAGMAGVLCAIRLRELGVNDLSIYEKADRLGGTWRENEYPGLSCDVPSHLYSYSFAPNPEWSRTFAPGPEIQAYFERVADRHGVTDLIRFNKEITRCAFENGRWHLECADGTRDVADFVIAATGVLHHPNIPDFEGASTFNGEIFHSARWNHNVPIAGRRVGVVGTGSTATQIVTAIVGDVSELVLFQRTPQWIMPVENPMYSDEERAHFRDHPESIEQVREESARAFIDGFANVLVDSESPILLAIHEACEANLESSVRDPELRERLRPDYRAACKRLVMSGGFYDAIQQPNARLVTSGIERLEPAGVRTSDGVLHELDVLVLATGFRVDRFMRPMEVLGRGGVALDEVWSETPSAYMAISIPDFPNLFMINGPNGPVGNFSLIDVAELELAYILQLIERVQSGECREICASADAMKRFDEDRKQAAKTTIWKTGCRSWYLDRNGVPMAWPWTFDRFVEEMRSPKPDDFDLR